MKTVHTFKCVTWIDLDSPSQNEIHELMEQYDIDPLVGEEIANPSARPKADIYSHFIYLILHFPGLSHLERSVKEINFIIGKDYIITIHYSNIEFFHELKKTFEANQILQKNAVCDTGGYLFYFIMRGLYRSMSYELEYVRNMLGQIEHNIYNHAEREMVIELSRINRTLLSFKESLDLHKEVLVSYEKAGIAFFGHEYEFYTQSILGEYYKIISSITSNKDYLRELRETNDSLLDTRQNDIMQRLTIFNFFILPITLITAIFGMNTHLPFVGNPYDFEIILGLMLCIILFIYFVLKRQGWL